MIIFVLMIASINYDAFSKSSQVFFIFVADNGQMVRLNG